MLHNRALSSVDRVIQSLAYVGFVSPDANEWATFGPEVLGAQLAEADADGDVLLRIDDAAWRVAIHEGEQNDLAYIGWECGDADGLAEAVNSVRAAGFDVDDGGDLAASREVVRLATFSDPFGFRHELTYGLRTADTAFVAGRPMDAGFVTGTGGLGHLVLLVPDLDEASTFFQETLGFDHSDDVDVGMTIRFLHCNQRHHTLAFTAVPGIVGVHHLMLEVEEPDDVGRAYDIVNEREMPLAMTLGRHTNDEMFSFYVRSPSGFEIEYGAGARTLDTANPVAAGRYDSTSYWGHKPPATPLRPGILRPVDV